MGGEHSTTTTLTGDDDGSSTRGRGTHPTSPPRFRAAVHPRVGGEHGGDLLQLLARRGSSPRGRGTLWRAINILLGQRFIPAWAGNTTTSGRSVGMCPVHPRVGGEHERPDVFPALTSGSSPRGRGTRRVSCPQAGADRFIPAWAGNTGAPRKAKEMSPVHPRVGGEHFDGDADTAIKAGSSPRGRGTPDWTEQAERGWRFIPAWAGNTRRSVCQREDKAVHPRVGGEHEHQAGRSSVFDGSSPRGRGTLFLDRCSVRNTGFIPAWAGNTSVII